MFYQDENRGGYRKKINLLKISRFPNFVQYFPDFSPTKLYIYSVHMFRSISELISMPRIFNNKSGHGQDTQFKDGYSLQIISARTIKRNEFSFVILRNMSKKKIENLFHLISLEMITCSGYPGWWIPVFNKKHFHRQFQNKLFTYIQNIQYLNKTVSMCT